MKTTSLELSKQLKEAGYPQKALFYWVDNAGLLGGVWIDQDKQDYSLILNNNEIKLQEGVDKCASPTADEILDVLPKKLYEKPGELYWLQVEIMDEGYETDEKNGFSCQYFNPNFGVKHFKEAGNIADAAALMWLYLKKEGLI